MSPTCFETRGFIQRDTHTHTHTHTYIYIYIYIYRERERERERERVWYVLHALVSEQSGGLESLFETRVSRAFRWFVLYNCITMHGAKKIKKSLYYVSIEANYTTLSKLSSVTADFSG